MKVVTSELPPASKILSGRKLSLNYQPVINYREHKVYCLEALINWKALGIKPADAEDFIAKIENNPALSTTLDSFVVRRAIKDLYELSQLCDYEGSLSVNISPHSLQNTSFIEQLKRLLSPSALASSHIEPAKLVIEITERQPWSNPALINEGIAALTELGVRIAVDDFITGYANFGVLLNENVSIVKIDRSITAGLLARENVRVFAEQFKELADHLKKVVIVEGIEECEQVMWLHDHGYQFLQGYFFAVPTDITGIARYLKTQSAYRY